MGATVVNNLYVNMLPLTKLLKTCMISVLFVFSGNAYANNVFEKPVITKELVLKANKDQVWSALTDHNELEKWWNKGVRLEPFVGGEFYEPWGDGQLATGKVAQLAPLKFIEFTWQEKTWNSFENTKCSFTLKEFSGKTVIYVEHSGWEIFKSEEKVKRLVKGFEQEWDSLLPKLKRHIESKE